MTNHPNRARAYYAAHNAGADVVNGNDGFANTWEVSRFRSRAERDAFVVRHDNQRARAVTRKDAEATYRDGYLSVGAEVPAGGLFGADAYGLTNFWNESN